MQKALDAVPWAVCTSGNPAIKHSPCCLAFNHDMIFRHAIKINWDNINAKWRRLLVASNAIEDKSCLSKQNMQWETKY
jgi:hypothetical protein